MMFLGLAQCVLHDVRLEKEGVKAICSVPKMRLCCSQHLGLPEHADFEISRADIHPSMDQNLKELKKTRPRRDCKKTMQSAPLP